MPDSFFGDEVAAAAPSASGPDVAPSDLRAFVKAWVAAYKCPRRVVVFDDLPKGPSGKILKREIDLGLKG